MDRWLSTDVEMCVISIAVDTESMLTNDLAKREHVYGEKQGAGVELESLVMMFCVVLERQE